MLVRLLLKGLNNVLKKFPTCSFYRQTRSEALHKKNKANNLKASLENIFPYIPFFFISTLLYTLLKRSRQFSIFFLPESKTKGSEKNLMNCEIGKFKVVPQIVFNVYQLIDF